VDRRTDKKRRDAQMDIGTDVQIDRWTDRCINRQADVKMNRWTDKWEDGLTVFQVDRSKQLGTKADG